MVIYGLDPGPEQSAIVVYHAPREGPALVFKHQTLYNLELLAWLQHHAVEDALLVIEQIENMGMVVGASVFETVFWSGRFASRWEDANGGARWERLSRRKIKLALCGSMQAKDPNIRHALLDRWGSSRERAIGTKKVPGPLYGVVGHEWAALAVAVAWADLNGYRKE